MFVKFDQEILRIARRLGERRILGDRGLVHVSAIALSIPFASGVGRLDTPPPLAPPTGGGGVIFLRGQALWPAWAGPYPNTAGSGPMRVF